MPKHTETARKTWYRLEPLESTAPNCEAHQVIRIKDEQAVGVLLQLYPDHGAEANAEKVFNWVVQRLSDQAVVSRWPMHKKISFNDAERHIQHLSPSAFSNLIEDIIIRAKTAYGQCGYLYSPTKGSVIEFGNVPLGMRPARAQKVMDYLHEDTYKVNSSKLIRGMIQGDHVVSYQQLQIIPNPDAEPFIIK
ncbi:hypothetical protein RYA05_02680 [Pseudomonas syringae pv. actinidiae]|nr:hypothetical protein [Pseudomonas syringae pv. actinidiae]